MGEENGHGRAVHGDAGGVNAGRTPSRRRRPRVSEKAQASIAAAKLLLAESLLTGARRVANMITDPQTPLEAFTWAMGFAGDRGGMPRMNQAELIGKSGLTFRLELASGERGWLADEETGDVGADPGHRAPDATAH